MKRIYLKSITEAKAHYPDFTIKENHKSKTSLYKGQAYTYLGQFYSQDEILCRKIGTVFAFIGQSLLIILSLGFLYIISKSYQHILAYRWKECKFGKELIRIYVQKKMEEIQCQKDFKKVVSPLIQEQKNPLKTEEKAFFTYNEENKTTSFPEQTQNEPSNVDERIINILPKRK